MDPDITTDTRSSWDPLLSPWGKGDSACPARRGRAQANPKCHPTIPEVFSQCWAVDVQPVGTQGIPRGCSRTHTEEFWGFPDLPGHPGCILGVSSSPGHPGCWAEASHGSRCSQGSFSSPRPDSTQGKQHWRQWGHPPLMGDQGNSPFPLGLSQIPKSDSAPGLRLCGKHIESIIASFQPSLSKFGTSKAVLVLWVTQRPQPRCGCGQTPEQAGLPEVTVPPKTPARGMRI